MESIKEEETLKENTNIEKRNKLYGVVQKKMFTLGCLEKMFL